MIRLNFNHSINKLPVSRLFKILIITTIFCPLILLFSLTACHENKIGEEHLILYEGYSEIFPPFDDKIQKVISIAAIEIMKLGFDTLELDASVLENQNTYLVAYGPAGGIDTVLTDSGLYYKVTFGGAGDVVLSKKDLSVIKVYKTF